MTRLSDEEMENLYKYMASGTGLRQALAQVQDEAIARGKELRYWESQTTRLIEAAAQLMRGDCWCEVGIGNPMVTKHSDGCIAMQRCFAATQQDGE